MANDSPEFIEILFQDHPSLFHFRVMHPVIQENIRFCAKSIRSIEKELSYGYSRKSTLRSHLSELDIYRSSEKKISALLAIFTSSHRAAIVEYDTYGKKQKSYKVEKGEIYVILCLT